MADFGDFAFGCVNAAAGGRYPAEAAPGEAAGRLAAVSGDAG